MDIEQKLEIVRKGLELGGTLKFLFYSSPSEEAAVEIMTMLSQESHEKVSRDGCHWLSTGDDTNLSVTVFYEKNKKTRREELLAELAELDEYMIDDINVDASELA